MLPLAALLLGATNVALTPFTDPGGNLFGGTQPILLPLVRGATTVPGLGKAWVAGGALTVDRNHNGKPDPSEKIAFKRQDIQAPDGKTVSIYVGTVEVGPTVRYAARFFTGDSKDPSFARVRDRLALMPLFGYSGTARFGAKTMKIVVRGADLNHGVLLVDRDGDGRPGSVPMEVYDLGKPFNLGGATYRASAFSMTGRPSIAFALSTIKVAEVPMPPDLSVGKLIPPIPGKTLAGKAVAFPKGFPGKVVLLDVWATWCGPCKGEIPFMRDAYAKYRKRGFEICSMSIDDPGKGPQVAAFTKANGMTWTQVFQGEGWGSPVCQRYSIHSIPFMVLVDGSTGKIIATEDRLRGPALAQTLDGVLSMRGR